MLDLYKHTWHPATRPGLPTLVLLHGTGGNETSMLDVGEALLPGAARLSPRGNVSEHGMPRYFRRFAEGDFDLVDLAERTTALGGWLRAALDAYGVLAEPMIFAGYSNGANMAASLMLAGAVSARAAVLLRPMFVHRPEQLAPLAGTRVLIESGAQDRITPAASAAQLAELLRSAGAAVEQVVHEEAGHNLLLADVKRGTNWLREL